MLLGLTAYFVVPLRCDHEALALNELLLILHGWADFTEA